MKNILMFVLALIVIGIVWHFIVGLFASVVHIVITIAVIALLVWLVSVVYKALTREKLRY